MFWMDSWIKSKNDRAKYTTAIASVSVAIQGMHKGQRNPPLDCRIANASRSDGEACNNINQVSV